MPPAEEKAGAGTRLFAAIAALVLFFGAAVMFIVVINPDDTPLCGDVRATAIAVECFDVGETQYTISRIISAGAGALALAAGLLGLYVAATGRRASLMLRLGVAAVVLGGLAVLVNRI